MQKPFKKVNFDYGYGTMGFGFYVYEFPSNKILKFVTEENNNEKFKNERNDTKRKSG
jgi:hypothetical protein